MSLRVRARSILSLIAGATIAAVGGCHSSTSPSDALARTLARREAQWHAAGVHDYSFDFDVDAMVNSPPVRIDVRGDTVARVVVRATGAELSRAGWPTVDSLFGRARALIGGAQYHPIVTFDATLGYPTLINAASDVPDTGYQIRVANFVAGG